MRVTEVTSAHVTLLTKFEVWNNQDFSDLLFHFFSIIGFYIILSMSIDELKSHFWILLEQIDYTTIFWLYKVCRYTRLSIVDSIGIKILCKRLHFWCCFQNTHAISITFVLKLFRSLTIVT